MEGSLTSVAADAWVAPGALLSGDVRLSSQCSVFPGAVLRADDAFIELASMSNIQDNCVVEARPGQPVRIGARVTLGHNARVIGATIDERSLIAIGATVLSGAHIGSHTIIAANATVPEGMHVPPRSLVIGQGRIAREVTEAEIARIERGADEYARLCGEYLHTISDRRWT